jgi:gliding motility-associated-like protein
MYGVRCNKFKFYILHSAFYIVSSTACCFSQSPLTALVANAGNDASVCPGDTVKIGGNPSATGGTPPYTYSWQPATGLKFPNTPNPNAFPSSPTNYTLTVTDAAGNSSSDSVNVSIYALPIVNAGPDQTITQGTNTQLQASGAVRYYWYPPQTLTNQNTATPTAEPGSTTTYCVAGVDNHGCVNYDCMILHVKPSDTLIFYNAFSPNGDGNNEVFFIGNLEAFPENKLEIYNRNGKMVYQASPYNNDWNGKIDGVDIPCATYYYILYPGNGKSNKHGAVTIIR